MSLKGTKRQASELWATLRPTAPGLHGGVHFLDRFQMTDRRARRERLRGGDDSIGVDAVVPVEIRDRPGLAEMLDTERPELVAEHGAQPRQRRWMSVEDADDAAVWRQAAK